MSINIGKLLGFGRAASPAQPSNRTDAADEPASTEGGHPARPLGQLYRSEEKFEVSQAGLGAWRASPSFRRVRSFYQNYPAGSLQSDDARALLHHLIVMCRPERVLEIGTWHAGTTETMARALWETGRGKIETIDPFGGERCPPIIASFPPELREIITFRPENSATHFDRVMSSNGDYDFVLVDGNHEYEFALFDIMCAARTMRPGGLMVMDNIEQVGPRLAARTFLAGNPDWQDVADVTRHIDLAAPFEVPPASYPETKFYVLKAPPYHVIREEPRVFGPADVDRAELEGIDLELAAPAEGTLHVLVHLRTFGLAEPEELRSEQKLVMDPAQLPADGRVRIPLVEPLRTAFPRPDLPRRAEISLAFSGRAGLRLRSSPQPYPAAYGKPPGL